jgi:hypothetical protein
MSNRELRERIEELETELEQIRDRIDALLDSGDDSENRDLQ